MSNLLSTTKTEDFERFLEQKDFDSWLQEETSLNEGYLYEHNKTEVDGSNIDSSSSANLDYNYTEEDFELEEIFNDKKDDTEYLDDQRQQQQQQQEDKVDEEIEGLLSIKGLLPEQPLQYQQQINLFEKEIPLHDDDDVKEIESLLVEDKIKKEAEAKEGGKQLNNNNDNNNINSECNNNVTDRLENKDIHEKINSTENDNSVIVNEVILGEDNETSIEGDGDQVIDQVINDDQIVDDEHQIHVDDHVNDEIFYEEESIVRIEATSNLETKINKNNVMHHSRTMSGERFRCILAYEGNENPIFIKSDKIIGEFMEDLKVDLICDENLVKGHEVVLTFIDSSAKDFELILTEDNKYADELTLGNIIEAHKGFQKLYNIGSSDLIIMASLQTRFISRFQQFFNDSEEDKMLEPTANNEENIEDPNVNEFGGDDLINDNTEFIVKEEEEEEEFTYKNFSDSSEQPKITSNTLNTTVTSTDENNILGIDDFNAGQLVGGGNSNSDDNTIIEDNFNNNIEQIDKNSNEVEGFDDKIEIIFKNDEFDKNTTASISGNESYEVQESILGVDDYIENNNLLSEQPKITSNTSNTIITSTDENNILDVDDFNPGQLVGGGGGNDDDNTIVEDNNLEQIDKNSNEVENFDDKIEIIFENDEFDKNITTSISGNESYEAQESPLLGVDDYIENDDLLMDEYLYNEEGEVDVGRGRGRVGVGVEEIELITNEFELEDSLLTTDNNNFKIDGFNFSRKRERSPGPDNEGVFKKRINV